MMTTTPNPNQNKNLLLQPNSFIDRISHTSMIQSGFSASVWESRKAVVQRVCDELDVQMIETRHDGKLLIQLGNGEFGTVSQSDICYLDIKYPNLHTVNSRDAASFEKELRDMCSENEKYWK